MDPNINVHHVHNMGYWCVLRDHQGNIVFSGNNFVIQNAHTNEVRYLEDTHENRQYLQLTDAPPPVVEEPSLNQVVIIAKRPQDEQPIKPTTRKEVDPFWDKDKIKQLLTICLENKFRNMHPNAKEKILWQEIAEEIGTTSEECAKKYRNLRRTYIRLLKKKRQGRDVKWIYYNTCEEIFHESKLLNPSVLEVWEDQKVRQLLTMYIENLHRFRDPYCLKKDIWNEIAQEIGTTEYNCYHKFKNLKRTYFNWMERSKQTGKNIKWQFYQYFETIFYNYNPCVGPWDRNKTKLLLNTYSRIAHKFRNPKFQKKELWKEIATCISETPSNCDRKFRNLKQTYIKLKMKAETGKGLTKWRFYKDFEEIYDSVPCSSLHDSSAGKSSVLRHFPEEDYVKQMLALYIENLDKFRNPIVKKKILWRQIAPKLGISPDECDRKFRNLKQTYIRLWEKKRETGKCNKWPYFSFFEQIYSDTKDYQSYHDSPSRDDDICLSDIKREAAGARQNEAKERQESNAKFDTLVSAVEESNEIQRERNRILLLLLDSRNQ